MPRQRERRDTPARWGLDHHRRRHRRAVESDLDPLFEGGVEASEEAIVNARIAAPTMTGADGWRVFGLPHEELREILKRYGRLAAGAR